MSQHQLKHIYTIDRLNTVLTYIEFFKSSMTDRELLTAIQDQMDKHAITKHLIHSLTGIYSGYSPYLKDSPIILASLKLYGILTDLEYKCKHDLTNK